MRLFFSRSVWIRALLIALTFTVCAICVRLFWGYPRCQNDELNWIDIARNIDAGRDWPISGPSFMFVLRGLRGWTEMRYVNLISGLGVVSVFVGTLLIILGYSRLLITRPGITLIALALSSYFWVPLLEARPQQWGQIQVFIGAISAWMWLHRKGGWLFFPMLLLVSLSHILSHAILVFLTTALALADYFENRPMTRRHAILVTCVLLSLVVYLLPNGPYQTMLRDVEQHHLRRLLGTAPYLGAAALVLVLSVIAFKPRLHWRAHWSRHTMKYALAHQHVIYSSLIVVVCIALSAQAAMLPTAAWHPYGGSIWTFLIFQAGNIAFAGLFVIGLFTFFKAISNQEIETSHARMIVWTLIAFGILGLITLIASFWMLDTNWLLRLINYSILFAAPITAMGLSQMALLKKHPAAYALLIPLFVVSICQAVRPDGYLGC